MKNKRPPEINNMALHTAIPINELKLDPIDPKVEEEIRKLYNDYPQLKNSTPQHWATIGPDTFNEGDAWIQTYSGRRFNPINPVVEAIVIQDIAHSLSNICRFGGHCKSFYCVAQHSVLVSYICDFQDALHGLLHDASEAYLNDLVSPVKHSGKFDEYIKYEANVQQAVCKRFSLSETEPYSVKKADKILLATEARDLLSNLRKDWIQPVEPLPFKIDPWSPQQAEDMFMKRFFELTGSSKEHYQHYLNNKGSL